MSVFDCLRIALTALRANLLRSILTTLGIIIGVGSVIVMVAVGSGARSEVDKQIASLGSNMLVVFPGSQRTMGRAGGAGTTLPLSEGDMQAVREKIPGVLSISGYLRGSAPIVRGNANWITQVGGIHDQYLTVRDWKLSLGREFTPEDTKTGNRIALLGTTVVGKLFPGEADIDPTGQVIRIKNVPFTIVGVLESKGQNSFGQDQDDVVMLPITAARGRIIGKSQVINDQVGSIFVKFDDETNLAEAQEGIESAASRAAATRSGRDTVPNSGPTNTPARFSLSPSKNFPSAQI